MNHQSETAIRSASKASKQTMPPLLVLAGGFGTRLQSLLPNVPKALAPVEGAPFLELQIRKWRGQGITDFVFLLHHQADQIIAFLQEAQSKWLSHCKLRWSVEPTPLDTGGAIARAVRELGLSGDFFVTNADTWLGDGLPEMAHMTAPALAVVELADVSRYGSVLFDDQGRVLTFREKAPSKAPGWVNAGLYRMTGELFQRWDGHAVSLEKNVLAELIREGRLRAIPLRTVFIDIGIPADYARFCRWAASGRKEDEGLIGYPGPQQ